MASYPSDLPDWRLPVNYQEQSGVLRTEMDTGPAKMRKRFSAVTAQFTTSFFINGAQRATLESFYADNKAKKFDSNDPTDDQTKQFRFLASPRFELVVGGEQPEDRTYRVQLVLERMP